jgi:hypothetical protein
VDLPRQPVRRERRPARTAAHLGGVAAITVRVAFTLAVIAAALTVGAGFLEVASRVRAGISVPPGKTASRDRVDPAEDSGHEIRGPTSTGAGSNGRRPVRHSQDDLAT